MHWSIPYIVVIKRFKAIKAQQWSHKILLLIEIWMPPSFFKHLFYFLTFVYGCLTVGPGRTCLRAVTPGPRHRSWPASSLRDMCRSGARDSGPVGIVRAHPGHEATSLRKWNGKTRAHISQPVPCATLYLGKLCVWCLSVCRRLSSSSFIKLNHLDMKHRLPRRQFFACGIYVDLLPSPCTILRFSRSCRYIQSKGFFRIS